MYKRIRTTLCTAVAALALGAASIASANPCAIPIDGIGELASVDLSRDGGVGGTGLSDDSGIGGTGLSDDSGIPYAGLWRIVNDNADPRLSTVSRLATVLGLTLARTKRRVR